MSKTTYDLSLLNLSEGKHEIVVVALADGFDESDKSNVVTYAEGFTRVYVTLLNKNAVLSNMDTTKVYSIYANYTFGYVTYKDGCWTMEGNNFVLISQTSTSITFHCGTSSYYGFTTPYFAVEGSRKLTDASKYTLSGSFPVWSAPCFAENTLITTSAGEKKIQDITYDDNILVWNFDEGKLDYSKPIYIKLEQSIDSYWKVTTEDGKELKLIGSNEKSHRLYNKKTHSFEYPQDIPECKCEKVCEVVKFYNIVTAYHFNCYANGVLTSKRYSNMLYPIDDNMKYDKTISHTNLCTRDQFTFLTDEEFEKLRVAEMEYSDDMRDEIERFFYLKKR